MFRFRHHLAGFNYLICTSVVVSVAHGACRDDILQTHPITVSLRLRITPETTDVTSRSDRATTARMTYVEGPGRPRRLDLMTGPLVIDADARAAVEVSVVSPLGRVTTLDDLPSSVLDRLGRVLRGEWDFTKSDCASFAIYLAGLDIGPHGYATIEILSSERVRERDLRPGDLVGIENEFGDKVHLAIFLSHGGGGLYLSKFGDGKGPLEVTSLAQMIRFYDADDLHRYDVGL